jgi:hypothetical protein
MQNPDQLPLLIAFMVFTFIVMGGMSWMFAKWMKRQRDMAARWTPDEHATGHDDGHTRH